MLKITERAPQSNLSFYRPLYGFYSVFTLGVNDQGCKVPPKFLLNVLVHGLLPPRFCEDEKMAGSRFLDISSQWQNQSVSVDTNESYVLLVGREDETDHRLLML